MTRGCWMAAAGAAFALAGQALGCGNNAKVMDFEVTPVYGHGPTTIAGVTFAPAVGSSYHEVATLDAEFGLRSWGLAIETLTGDDAVKVTFPSPVKHIACEIKVLISMPNGGEMPGGEIFISNSRAPGGFSVESPPGAGYAAPMFVSIPVDPPASEFEIRFRPNDGQVGERAYIVLDNLIFAPEGTAHVHCPGDLNRDGVVDGDDISEAMASIGPCPGTLGSDDEFPSISVVVIPSAPTEPVDPPGDPEAGPATSPGEDSGPSAGGGMGTAPGGDEDEDAPSSSGGSASAPPPGRGG